MVVVVNARSLVLDAELTLTPVLAELVVVNVCSAGLWPYLAVSETLISCELPVNAEYPPPGPCAPKSLNAPNTAYQQSHSHSL